MGSNKTSLFLAMTMLMLRKCETRSNRHAQLCRVTLITGIRSGISRSESYRIVSSFAEKKKLVLK